uniref:NADH-ubiquinone oxidoreductase chain 2 n=1 Tax=Oecanthus sinensis TaxID=1982312 RepID=A0A1W6S5S3_9ORTH|nr:NADH dehydrogenase subunit 2 [Oecanthus sinensis]ARO75187.1 NADH dehydrogenase subunit 2 [Oecanthus sinensis]
MFNLSKLTFYMLLMLGTIISISSNTWPAIWMGLEINLMAFIPILYMKNNLLASEASLKYFLVQALASSLLLMSFITFNLFPLTNIFQLNYHLLITTILMIKMGAAPFHMWFPMVMEGCSWMNCIILMTWQKLAPLVIISYLNNSNTLMMIIINLSLLIGSLGGLIQTSTRKIMAYSSINHIGWMLSAILMSTNYWMIYFMIYSFLSFSMIMIFKMMSLYHVNQINMNNYPSLFKMILMLNMLSLGGLPPFLGFLPKWMILNLMTQQNMMFLMLIMVFTSLITLFYYMKLSMNSLLLMSIQIKSNLIHNQYLFPPFLLILFSSITILGLPSFYIFQFLA